MASRSKVESRNNTEDKDDEIVDHTAVNNKKSYKTNDRLNPATITGPPYRHQNSSIGGRGCGDQQKQTPTNTTGIMEQNLQQDRQYQNVHLHGRMAELQADMERHELEMMRLKKRMVSIVNKVQVNNINCNDNEANNSHKTSGNATANTSNGIINAKSLPNRYSPSAAATTPGAQSSRIGLTASRTTASTTASSDVLVTKTLGKTALVASVETSPQPSSLPEWMKQLKQKQQQQKHQQQSGTAARTRGGGSGGSNGSRAKAQFGSTVAKMKTKNSTPATATPKTKKSFTTISASNNSVPFDRAESNNNKKKRGDMVITSNNPDRAPKVTTITTPMSGQMKSSSTATAPWKKPAPAVSASTASSSSSSSSPPPTAGLLAEIRKGTKLNKVSLPTQTKAQTTKAFPKSPTKGSALTPSADGAKAPAVASTSELFMKIQQRKKKLEQKQM